MEYENEQINSGVENAVSPEPQQESASQETQSATPPAQEQTKPDTTPFHEHPRFKELVEQKNRALEQAKELERRYADLNEKVTKFPQPKQEPKVDPLLSRLKEIDPEFGNRFEQLDQSQRELAELRAWKQEQETQRLRDQALNTVKELHTKNNVSEEMRDLYDSQLRVMAQQNPGMRMEDIPAAYSKIHERMSKLIDGIKRAERESYVTSKKSDASTPASVSKGAPSKPGGKMEWSKDPAERRQQLIKSVIKQSKTSNEV